MYNGDVELVHSKERNSWNVIVDGEWYFEGTYEEAEECANVFRFADDDEYEDYEYDEYDVSAEDYREWCNANCGIDNDAPWLR